LFDIRPYQYCGASCYGTQLLVFLDFNLDSEILINLIVICVFILIGVICFNVFAILETLRPGFFSEEESRKTSTEMAISLQTQSSNFFYYGFVMPMPFGFDEIIPLSQQALTTATLEDIAGQLCIAVLIDRLGG